MAKEQFVTEVLQETSRREAKHLLTVWFALGASIGVYVLLGSIFAGESGPVSLSRARVDFGPASIGLAALRWGVISASLLLLLAAGIIAHRFLGEGAVMAHARGNTAEERMRAGFAYLRRYSLLAWASAELVILVGTLWAILSGQQLAVIPFAIAGGTALFLLKPEEVSLMQLADRMARGDQSA